MDISKHEDSPRTVLLASRIGRLRFLQNTDNDRWEFSGKHDACLGWDLLNDDSRPGGNRQLSLDHSDKPKRFARFSQRAEGRGRLALLFGAEGGGLSPEAEAAANLRIRIPMAAGIDSLNVATACGIALHRLLSVAE